MGRTKNKYAQWIPFAAMLILTVITLIAYTLMNKERTLLMYVQVTAAALVTAILPIISTITKRNFPPIINVMMIHILLASNLGSAMGFYSKFECWDLVMHGYFGFVAAVTLYLLLLRRNGDKLNRFGFFAMIFLETLGGAAIWEMFEFTCDTLLGSDAQRVQESLLLGLSPVKDTMTDIIVAVVGVLVFFVGLYLNRFNKYKNEKNKIKWLFKVTFCKPCIIYGSHNLRLSRRLE